MKQIDVSEYASAQRLAAKLADAWSVILPSDALRNQAANLVSRYDLRAGDALQLSAALIWCGTLPQGRIFLTDDARLRNAALLCGFDARQL
jgi:hypothetical protein